MNKSFKRFKNKLTKVSLIAVVGVVTCSLAYGSSVQNGAIVDKKFPSLEDGGDSIIEDKVDPEGYIKIIKAKSVFNKKENMICLEWDSEKKEGKYKVYKLATEEDLDESDKEDIKEINEKKFILLKEVQECELKVENACKPNVPKVNMPKECVNELEVTIEGKESSLIQSYYVESIDENGNVVEKTEEIKVDLDNTIKGYSYVINSKEEDEPDEKIDTKKNVIKIELDNSKKYLHIRAIDVNGIAGESVTIELPKADSNEKSRQVKKIVRTNQINHNIKPSDWTNKDVDINVHAISKKGFKQITYPDGIIEDLTTSGLHLYGGEGRDDFKNVAPTKDGGFIAVGESNSSTFNGEKLSLAGGMDAIIVKYDEGGNVEWVKTWGRTGADAFHGVTEVVKNNKVVGYVAVGESNTVNTYNSVVVRFDVNGNKIWEDIIPGVAVNEVLWDVIQDSAGRIVTTGWHTSNVKDDRDGIIRIYELDSPQAIKVVTSPYDIPSENKWFSEGYDAIKEVPDGYVVVGSSREWNVSSRIYEPRVGRIVKFDKELNVVWNKSFKGAYNLDKEMDFDNVVLTSDGNIVVVGDGSVDKGEDVLEEAKGDRDGFIIKFNIKDGSIIWSKRFGGSGEEQMYGIQERSNGDLVVIGETSSSDKDFSGTIKEPNEMKLDDVFVMTFAGDTGEKVGAVTRIGGKGNDIGWAIRTLNDGRLVSVGTTTSGQSQGNDAFVCFIKGTTDINAKYTVSENGTYKFKFTDVSNAVHDYSVTVSNIDKEPPQVVLSDKTDDDVYKINAKVTDNVGIAVQKWATGEQSVDYFSENGNVFTGNEIEVDPKNTYTVYARDLAGNESKATHLKLQDGELPSITLSAEANHSGNYIDLKWEADVAVDSYVCKAYGRKVGDKDFQPISSVDFDRNEPVKVLNVYPTKGVPIMNTFTTWDGEVVSGLPQSAQLKKWMEEPNEENPKGYGKGIIEVIPISLESFNSNPVDVMKNADGSWKYDVIMFGTWDSYCNQDISSSSLVPLKQFMDEGYGVLFGHDFLTDPIYSGNRGTLASYAKVTYGGRMYNGQSTVSEYPGPGNSAISLYRKGVLTNFPWQLGEVGTKLSVPATHTSYQFAHGYVWVKFDYNGYGLDDKNNFYLTSSDNVAMIQTGHSNGQATSDEQKVIANTLFYLKQLFSIDRRQAENRNGIDLNAPTMPTIKTESARKFSLTRGFEKVIRLELDSEDLGTTYEHYVEGTNKFNYDEKVKSNMTSTEIKTGIKGYSYIVDTNNQTEPDNIVNTTDSLLTFNADDVKGKYIHIKAIDYAGNASETLHYQFKTSVIQADYSVSNGKVTEADGSAVSTLFRKGDYTYSFDVNNLTGEPFIETFGGSGNDHIYATIVHDGNYISGGCTVSTNYDFSGMNKGKNDAFLVKHNNKGEIIWKKTIGGSSDDYIMGILLEEDGYILVGYTESTDGDFKGLQSGGSFNPFIMKVDFEGNIIWNNPVFVSGWTVINGVTKRDDGGYILVGSTQGHSNFSSTNVKDIILVGVSELGKTEYTRFIGGNLNDVGERAINNEDGTYTIIGQTYSTSGLGVGKGEEDGVLIKVDSSGSVLKIKRFGGSGNDHFRAEYRMENGDLLIVGYTESNDKDLLGAKTTLDRDGLVVLFDKDLNTKWVKTVGGTENEWLLAVYADETGIMTSGFGGSNDGDFAGMNNGGNDAIIARFTLDGELEWTRSFGGSGEERLRAMVRTPEGGYLIGGDTASKDNNLTGSTIRGGQDALLVKFNPDGSFGMMPYDNEISEVKYKIETNSSGVRRLVKEGTYTNLIVDPGRKITKSVNFTVPDRDAEEVVVTVQLKDNEDATLSNNKIETRIPILQLVDTDYAIKNDKIVDMSGAEQKDEIQVGLTYNYNFDVSNIDTTPFIKTFGGSGNEHFEKHIITSDGGILAVGRTGSTDKDLVGMNKGGNDALIVKYDQFGNVEWKDSYGGSGSDMFFHAAEVSDGYIAVGQFNGKDNLIVKYSKSGKVILEKKYRDSQVSATRVIIIQANADDSFYIADTSYNSSTRTYGPSYAKYDKNLNQVWRKYLHQSGEPGATTIYGLDVGSSGDIYITGKFGAATGDFAKLTCRGGMDAFVVKASGSTGEVIWKNSISGSAIDDARQAAETDDGMLIVIGRTTSGDGDLSGMKKTLDNRNFASDSIASDSTYRLQDGWVAKMSASDGKTRGLKVVGGGGYDNLRYLKKMKDGNFLISGDTASLDGDFAGREVKDSGYSDAIWIKMDKNLNIKWLSVLGGNRDDATQSGIELPDGSIVVAGETKSTNGDFARLNKGGQDAFIARLNADGELEMYPHDEQISHIKYNFTWSDGVNSYPAKSGSLDNVSVPVGKTINKNILFEVPRDSRIKTMTFSAEIVDSKDGNEANNRVSKTINVSIPRDYLFEGYNVKEKGKSALVGTLRKNTEYELNLKLKNRYIGADNVRQRFVVNSKFSAKNSYIPKIDSLKYKIVSTDGLNPQNVDSITLSNVKGTVLAQGEKRNIEIQDQSSVWEKITFKTLDDESMSEIIFVAEMDALDDGDVSNNRFVVKLPIVNKEEPEISINEVTVYPGSGEDGGKLMIGNEMNVKVVLGCSTLKTHDVDVKLYIEDGNKRVEMDKKAFGVSEEYPGVVYFKYKPENIGRIKVVAEINTEYGEESFGPIYSYVEKSKEPKQYAVASEKKEDGYDIAADVITYLKTQKRDKDVIKTRYCADKRNCQQNFNGSLVCPGHEYWDWGDWYNAYVPVKSTKLNGFKEAYEIKKVLFRSKETEKMRDRNLKEINDDGTVDLMDEESSEFAYVKAGYGFELKVETEYKNNLPELMKKASVANIAPNNTKWSQYKIIQHNQPSIPFIYYSEKLKGIDKLILSNNGVVSFTVPSLDDIIIENPDQLYLKTPDNKYIMVDEGYGGVYGDDVSTSLEVVDTSSKGVTGNSYYDTKIIEFKKPNGDALARRNYYISDKLKDGKHKINIFNRYSGYGATNNNKLHVNNDFDIIIKGGRYDDMVDMAQ